MDDMEELLKRYRPLGPPAGLRARVTARGGAPDAGRSIVGWLLVAATLVCAVLFYALAAREHRRMVMRIPPPIAVAREPVAEPWP